MISSSDQLRVIAFLKRFGCNASESIAYIEVLTSGTTSIQELSRKLKQNRVSLYYSIQQLIEKGFLFEIRKGKKRFIVAENPEILFKLIKQRHLELKSLETDVMYITKLLNSIPVVKQEVTVVKLYENVEGYKKMLQESLGSKHEILIFSNSTSFSKMIGEDYYENYLEQAASLGIKIRLISSPSPFAYKLHTDSKKYLLDLRIVRQSSPSESGFYLWGETLVIESLKENKTSCTIIENQEVANFYRENIFNHFWKEAILIDVKPGDALVNPS